MSETKTCSACKQAKSLDDFSRNAKGRFGRSSYCRVCTKARSRCYYEANQQAVKDRSRAWRQAHPEYEKSYSGIRYRRNKVNRNAYTRGYYKANRERLRGLIAEWHKMNREAVAIHDKRRRARERGATLVAFTAEQLAARWAYYGNRCWICQDDATETDHVKPVSKGGSHMLGNLRPICVPCNRAKHARWPFDVATFRLGRAKEAA